LRSLARGYAFDSWTPAKGLRRAYTYRRTKRPIYARNPNQMSVRHGRRFRALNDLTFENETRAVLLREQDLITPEKFHAMDLLSL
jgi:hypothetical protein